VIQIAATRAGSGVDVSVAGVSQAEMANTWEILITPREIAKRKLFSVFDPNSPLGIDIDAVHVTRGTARDELIFAKLLIVDDLSARLTLKRDDRSEVLGRAHGRSAR
jgi:hypothetical protein